MLEILLGAVAIIGGLGCVGSANTWLKWFGLVPIVVVVTPFLMDINGEPPPVGLRFGVEAAAAVLGAILFQVGRSQKLARIADADG